MVFTKLNDRINCILYCSNFLKISLYFFSFFCMWEINYIKKLTARLCLYHWKSVLLPSFPVQNHSRTCARPVTMHYFLLCGLDKALPQDLGPSLIALAASFLHRARPCQDSSLVELLAQCVTLQEAAPRPFLTFPTGPLPPPASCSCTSLPFPSWAANWLGCKSCG